MNQQHIKIDDQITLQIKRLGINGEGIGYDKKLAIFVLGALPGERVDVEITQVFNNRAIARLVRVINQADDRRMPFCPVYESCGGCQLQHLDYEQGLREKRQLLIQALDRYVPIRIAKHRIKDTIGMSNPKYYRNQASLPLRKAKRNQIGMYQTAGHKFIPIENCPVQNEHINRVYQTILMLMTTIGIDAYDQKYRKGFITNIVIRITSQHMMQVTFVCKKLPNRLAQLTHELMEKEPMVQSVFRVIATKNSRDFFNDSLTKIAGKDHLIEQLGSYSFSLSPNTFFKLNTKQATVYYETMKKKAQLKGYERCVDAHGGVAAIATYIADACRKVYTIESHQALIEDAKRSLAINQITNVEIINASFEKALKQLSKQPIDAIFFDLPRTGLGEKMIAIIKETKPKKIIYGSCNPSILAKDIASLLDEYVLDEITPIDMFPFTAHVESITLLSLKSA